GAGPHWENARRLSRPVHGFRLGISPAQALISYRCAAASACPTPLENTPPRVGAAACAARILSRAGGPLVRMRAISAPLAPTRAGSNTFIMLPGTVEGYLKDANAAFTAAPRDKSAMPAMLLAVGEPMGCRRPVASKTCSKLVKSGALFGATVLTPE